MRTDFEQQLPRFAEALDREAPAISVDEIFSSGTVAVDVDRLAPPAWDQAPRLAAVSSGEAMPGHGENGEREAFIELAARPPARRRVALKVALGVAAAVLVVALAAVVRTHDERDPADVPSPTVPTPPTTTPPTTIPVGPFVGAWLSTDTDGSSQTMEITRSGADEYQVVIRDEAATAACAGGASTMTGAARLATDTSLVIAQPELTCDDGTIPPFGPPPQAELADFTLDLYPTTGELVDTSGIVWQREGSNVDLDGPTSSSPTSGGMWPQSTLEEVRGAQELADASDPAYAWQVDPQLVEDDSWIGERHQVELVDRFLREVLGWEAYMLNGREGMVRNGVYDVFYDQRYVRCAPGRTNPLYPPGPQFEWGEMCAPTLDDLRYESVSLDLVQLDRQGRDGIWVVNQWRLTAPFAQADPVAVEAQAARRLEKFLAARVAGNGAEGHVRVEPDADVPLLYATTSGARYTRYEIERVNGPHWPNGDTTFRVRLFADGDATVVEQEINWDDGLWMDANSTTENGEPVVLSHTSSDGEVTVSAPNTWETWLPGKGAGKGGHEQALDVWFGGLWRSEESFGIGERIEFVDPVAYDQWCAGNGGSPLLSAPADAAAIAHQLVADPNFETTAPLAARIDDREALSIDVALAPGGKACGIGMIDISRWIHGLESGTRLRLYLVDLPEGMSVQTLAITVVAPAERFDEFIEETAPIIDSIEFHPRAP
ncbi:MAG: hypothetical protein QOJ08_1956 [Ilumatobacteraceae bacterium]|jgi:hypothetical protein